MRPKLLTLAALLMPAFLTAGETLPAHRARMYPKPAAEMWQAVQATLAEVKLKTAEVDAANQVLITKFKGYGADSATEPRIPGYHADRFQLHVFVSPFAEPARVHVGSVTQLTKMRGGTSTMYNGGEAEAWFFERLEKKLGMAGRPIPVDRAERIALAQELGAPEPCRPNRDDPSTPAAVIEKSRVEIEFPAAAAANATKGTVVLGVTVGEDGGIYQLQAKEDSAPDQQFRNAAMGAVWLFRFTPARFGTCPVHARFDWTVPFTIARRGR
jgi:TonB family protein